MTYYKDFPAFPTTDECSHYGLTKRELFAAMAMQGALSSNPKLGYSAAAMFAVRAADALLEELRESEG